MLALSSPLPMQGCFFRAAPARLTTSLYVSVSRRISGSGIAFCSEGFRPAASTNSDSSSASSSSSSSSSSPSASPPSHYAPRQSDADQVQGSVLRTTLAPLPSSSRSDAFWSNFDDSPASPGENFRSVGSRSEPSRSSIPGKFSKYSKPISKAHTANAAKRAERRDKKAFRKPMGDIGAEPDRNVVDAASTSSSSTHLSAAEKRKVGLSADSVDQIPEWMKNYKFSYTETPSAPIVGFRQTPWSPFGPSDMVLRPWTGRAPLQPSKKKRGEFDSFNPPPAGKKGVKYVQKPGPFLPGEGPKQAKSREEILGAPLTPLEIQELVHTVNKGNKQLNLGRDGLTHNMLDVIHKHWKRSVVCKIKCKGVPTIDMDNVARVIEEKTGGVIISRTGGVIYLFRGRNYNYKDRPDIPVMLWKPPDPIYPRLIQAVPEGLTEEEAKTLRAKGRKVAPMCRLSKNGVYMTLVADVKAQFEIDDVVRVDCQGMHATDYKKIGAKLKELVPCTLLSFEKEQIIMCRKRPVSDAIDNHDSEDSLALGESGDESNTLGSTGLQEQVLVKPEHALEPVRAGNGGSVIENDPDPVHSEVDDVADDEDLERASGVSSEGHEGAELQLDRLPDLTTDITDTTSEYAVSVMEKNFDPVSISQDGSVERVASLSATTGSDHKAPFGGDTLRQVDFENSAPDLVNAEMSSGDGVNRDNFVSGLMEAPFVDIDNLWQSAIDEGKAIELDNQNVDADDVLKKAAQLSGVTDAVDKEETMRLEEETKAAEESRVKARMPATSPFDVSSKRGLGLDELAKLLAP